MATSKKRLVGLDILRDVMTLVIFLFHAWTQMNIDYGFANCFLTVGAVCMEGFFLLSGFVLTYVYAERYFQDEANFSVLDFYGKRFLTLYPMYLLMVLISKCLRAGWNLKGLMVLPFELLGITSFFEGTYDDGVGNWFVSCMFFSYLCFPLLLKILKEIKNKKRWLFVLWFVCSLAPIVASVRGYAWVYPSPFFRMLQFFMGMILAQGLKQGEFVAGEHNGSKAGLFALTLVAAVSALNLMGFGSYASYEFVTLPLFSAMILCLAKVEITNEKTIALIEKPADISYEFYLAQTWAYYYGVGFAVIFHITGLQGQIFKFVTALVICLISAILMHKLNRWIQKKVKAKKAN